MAKKIRFPLKMKDGVEVRTIEDLKEKFSLERIVLYLFNGKLIVWLQDHYLANMANSLLELSSSDAEFYKKICDIFEVEYDNEKKEEVEKIMQRFYLKGLLSELDNKESRVCYELLSKSLRNFEVDVSKELSNYRSIEDINYVLETNSPKCCLFVMKSYSRFSNEIKGGVIRNRGMNLSLAMLYDYRKLNNHGKSIMQYSNSHVEEWSSQYSSIDDLKDIKNKINSAKEFANYCAMDENCWEAYNFIFWAMMILVTQNIKEEKLSVICDFSRILGITKEEM